MCLLDLDAVLSSLFQILRRLVNRSFKGDTDLAWTEWLDVLRAVQKHKLHGFALPLYAVMRLQQETQVLAAAAEATPSSSPSPSPLPTPAELRIPADCMTALLQSALHSSVSQYAALHLTKECRTAIDGFFASASAPLPGASADKHQLAWWMLEDMRTRGGGGGDGKEDVWSDRFDWSSGDPANVLLRVLGSRSGNLFRHAERLRCARALFTSMVVRDGDSYLLFQDALRGNKEHDAANEVERMMFADRSRTSPACIAVRLVRLRSQTSMARERALLQAEELWSELVANPQGLLDVSATRAMLQLLHHCGGDAARMQAVVAQALQLEAQVGAERRDAANPDGDRSDWELSNAAPVAVDASCVELLLQAFASSAQPSSFAQEASAAHETMLRRYAVAVACNAHRRAARLTPSTSARRAFLQYLHRAGLYAELVSAWRALSLPQQHACADQVTAILLDLDQGGQPAQAEKLSAMLQGQGTTTTTAEGTQQSHLQ